MEHKQSDMQTVSINNLNDDVLLKIFLFVTGCSYYSNEPLFDSLHRVAQLMRVNKRFRQIIANNGMDPAAIRELRGMGHYNQICSLIPEINLTARHLLGQFPIADTIFVPVGASPTVVSCLMHFIEPTAMITHIALSGRRRTEEDYLVNGQHTRTTPKGPLRRYIFDRYFCSAQADGQTLIEKMRQRKKKHSCVGLVERTYLAPSYSLFKSLFMR